MKEENLYPTAKEVLKLLSLGVVLGAATLVAPGLGEAFRYYSKSKWRKYRPSYLKRTVKRLLDRELVSIKEAGSKSIVKLTEKGKQKVLEFSFDEIKIPERDWDGRWRLVVFDIPNSRRKERDMFRRKLKELGFFPLQESVFIFPYECKDQIDFLRETLLVRDYVRLLLVEGIENEDYYKSKFNLL